MAAVQRYAEWSRRYAAGPAGGAFLLAGPESLLRDQALARIRERTLGPAGSQARPDRYQAGEAPLSQVASALSTVGLFDPVRLVVLSDPEKAGRAAAAERRALLGRLREGTPGSVFVACSRLSPFELEKKNEFTRELLGVCTVISLEHPRPADALRWLLEEAQRRGLRLQADAGKHLLSRIGPDLQELSRELEKLESAAPPGTPLGVDLLRELVRRGELGTGWELCRAACEGRTSDALRQWGALSATEPVLRLQWLLQKNAREAAAGGAPGAAQLARLAYELEYGIKCGLIPARQDGAAFEFALLTAGAGGARSGRPHRSTP